MGGNMNRSKVMKRAWALYRAMDDYASFGEALRDAWAEAKGDMMILDTFELDPVAVMGRLARSQLGRMAA
jgi:hypothetical protein